MYIWIENLRDLEILFFLKNNAKALSYELKIVTRGLITIILDSDQSYRKVQKKILRGLEDGTITSSRDIFALVERLMQETISHQEKFLQRDCHNIKLLNKLIKDASQSIKKNKKRLFACLHSMKPIALDAALKNELRTECDKYLLSDKKVSELKKLINSKVFDVIFESLENMIQDPEFHKAMTNKKNKGSASQMNFLISLSVLGFQAYSIVEK